jgi:hypothetical protein
VLGLGVLEERGQDVGDGDPADGVRRIILCVGGVLLGGQLLDELCLCELPPVAGVGRFDEFDLAVGAGLLDRGVPPPGLRAEPDLLHCETPEREGTTAVPQGSAKKGRPVAAGRPFVSLLCTSGVHSSS